QPADATLTREQHLLPPPPASAASARPPPPPSLPLLPSRELAAPPPSGGTSISGRRGAEERSGARRGGARLPSSSSTGAAFAHSRCSSTHPPLPPGPPPPSSPRPAVRRRPRGRPSAVALPRVATEPVAAAASTAPPSLPAPPPSPPPVTPPFSAPPTRPPRPRGCGRNPSCGWRWRAWMGRGERCGGEPQPRPTTQRPGTRPRSPAPPPQPSTTPGSTSPSTPGSSPGPQDLSEPRRRLKIAGTRGRALNRQEAELMLGTATGMGTLRHKEEQETPASHPLDKSTEAYLSDKTSGQPTRMLIPGKGGSRWPVGTQSTSIIRHDRELLAF
ncbi:unnamed protein product, partial [Urochloa humidicola]